MMTMMMMMMMMKREDVCNAQKLVRAHAARSTYEQQVNPVGRYVAQASLAAHRISTLSGKHEGNGLCLAVHETWRSLDEQQEQQ